MHTSKLKLRKGTTCSGWDQIFDSLYAKWAFERPDARISRLFVSYFTLIIFNMAANNNFSLEGDMISNSAENTSSRGGATSFGDGDVIMHTASVSQENPMVPTITASSSLRQQTVDSGNKGSTLALQDGSSASRSTTSSEDYRIEVRLKNGNFTSALKNALLRDLNSCLYSSPSRSFVPSSVGQASDSELSGSHQTTTKAVPGSSRSLLQLMKMLAILSSELNLLRCTNQKLALTFLGIQGRTLSMSIFCDG